VGLKEGRSKKTSKSGFCRWIFLEVFRCQKVKSAWDSLRLLMVKDVRGTDLREPIEIDFSGYASL
jgi:hypothetical protein